MRMQSRRKSASLSCRRFRAWLRVVYRDAEPPFTLSDFFTALPPACFVCFVVCLAGMMRARAWTRPRSPLLSSAACEFRSLSN